jgi:hypothetical protein
VLSPPKACPPWSRVAALWSESGTCNSCWSHGAPETPQCQLRCIRSSARPWAQRPASASSRRRSVLQPIRRCFEIYEWCPKCAVYPYCQACFVNHPYYWRGHKSDNYNLDDAKTFLRILEDILRSRILENDPSNYYRKFPSHNSLDKIIWWSSRRILWRFSKKIFKRDSSEDPWKRFFQIPSLELF